MKLHKTIMFISFIILGITTAFAQVSENRNVSSFDKINTSTGIHVKYIQGDKFSLKIEAENQKIVDAIVSTVSNNTLSLSIKKNQNIKTKKGIIAYVTCPSLEAISTSSGSKFTAEKVVAKRELSISTSSGSTLRVENIDAPKGTLINTSSGSNIKIIGLKTSNLNLSASSGSSCKLTEVSISNHLKAASSSGASIKIEGKAEDVNLSSSSGSSINIKGLTYKTVNVTKDKGASISK